MLYINVINYNLEEIALRILSFGIRRATSNYFSLQTCSLITLIK